MKLTRRSFLGASTLVALSVLALTTVVLPCTAQAQEGGNETPVMIKGYWGGTTATDPAVIGTINIVGEFGKNARPFGVLVARAYDPPSTGMDMFQQAAMKPAIVVFGRATETKALFNAGPKQPVTILGVYYRDSGDLILGSVKTAAAPAAPAAAAK